MPWEEQTRLSAERVTISSMEMEATTKSMEGSATMAYTAAARTISSSATMWRYRPVAGTIFSMAGRGTIFSKEERDSTSYSEDLGMTISTATNLPAITPG